MFDFSLTLIVAATLSGILLVGGTCTAMLMSRGGRAHEVEEAGEEEVPERLLRELERCLELGQCVARDGDALATIMAAEATSMPRGLTSAIQQLIKTTKSLATRLDRAGAEAGIARCGEAGRIVTLPSGRNEPDDAGGSLLAPAKPVEPALVRPAVGEIMLPGSPYAEARRFKRSSFRGSAQATIYPRQSGPGRQPMQCTVLTRDLSCGGIGLGHCEQLFPKQIVVLDVVGKLLVGEIRWCRRVDEDFYVAGCRLVKTHA